MTRAWPQLVLLGALALALPACDGSRSGVTVPPVEREPVEALSTDLLAALAQARSYHHIADLELADGAVDAAAAALAKILEVRFPDGAPEGEDTALDARARLAKLELGRGRFEAAQRLIEDGLARSRRDSFFLAHLHSVAGELHEARARSLDASGSDGGTAAARAERKLAISAYHSAIEINERVQQALAKEARP